MAITDENTVLILGAGTSVVFGMPLGGGLIGQIAAQIGEENRKLYELASSKVRHSYYSILNDTLHNNKGILKFPIHAAIFLKYKDDFKEQKEKLVQLLRYLEGQTSETIDDFIVENPSYAELSKICISAIFLKKLYTLNSSINGNSLIRLGRSQRGFGVRDGNLIAHDSDLTTELWRERNWVHLLINIVRQGVHSGKVTSENKVQIITFNYDVILEHVLDEQFSNTELMQGKDWRNYFEIIHPHGKCAPWKEDVFKGADLINKWAEGIHVINQDYVSEDIQSARNRAKEMIANAREIYAAGFAFAGPNCKMLGLKREALSKASQGLTGPHKTTYVKFNREIFICNYDGNIGLSMAVKKLQQESESRTPQIIVTEQTGDYDKPLGVADWIKIGVLGELP